jgi:hypothetical protein
MQEASIEDQRQMYQYLLDQASIVTKAQIVAS